MTEDAAKRSSLAHLVQDAVARGQAALEVGERAEAKRWLERARRLAPADGAVGLFLASALIGEDNARSAALFAEMAAAHDVRDAWLGLATTRFLMGDMPAVAAALAEVLSRHALWPEVAELADGAARVTGAAGWCGLTGDGVLVVHPVGDCGVEIQVDGERLAGRGLSPGRRHGPPRARPGHLRQHEGESGGPIRSGHDERTVLSPSWPSTRSITVTAGGRHLIGSPISPLTIGRVQGFVEASPRGLRGWAWHPGAPDVDPTITIGTGPDQRTIVATQPVDGIPGLAPLARPRSFALRRTEPPDATTKLHVRGQNGRDLPGSPIGRASDPKPRIAPSDRNPAPSLAAWREATTGTVILITHNDGGGVERRVQAAVTSHTTQGRRAIVLRPGATGVMVESAGLPTQHFALPRQQSALLRLLRATGPVEAELHHFLNLDPSILQILQALGVPYDAHVHDYAWFCPRIALVGRGDRYCGEPAPSVCTACVETLGAYLREDIGVTELIARSRSILAKARRVIAPSADAAARMTRHFPGLTPIVVPHEDDADLDEPPPIPLVTGDVLVCVAGAIGLHKGYHVLLACARDARKRGLELSFIVAGTTIDDQRLIDTGRVFVTGPYQSDEAVDLIRAQSATLALFPSIWPETWSLGLTELWRAGLRVAAFDIGAPADRIRATGRGFLLPLGLSPEKINDALLNAARGRSFLPIRRSSAYKPPY